jgi:aryl-alcohol dehydrogenase-like predicted oxidoreductase
MTAGQTQLGPLSISRLGLGCMGMSWAYGTPNDGESLRTFDAALELGINFWDTAEVYGPFSNEHLLAKALKDRRSRVVVASKFGFKITEKGAIAGTDGSPENVKRACEASLKRLGVETIDLYYLHRLDKRIPIEETVGAMGELVREGKVRALGLSEVSAQTLRKACNTHAIAALQSEYSLWERGVEAEVLPACTELGVRFVAYSPLGRGFLTKARGAELKSGDSRARMPRFSPQHRTANEVLAAALDRISEKTGHTSAQIALAWLLARAVVPIPGTKQERYMRENAQSLRLVLDAEVDAALSQAFAVGAAHGERYHPGAMKMLDT